MILYFKSEGDEITERFDKNTGGYDSGDFGRKNKEILAGDGEDYRAIA